MRHLKAGNRLGITTAHRRAMMRNMVTSILENGQITCTLARAKAVRKPLEKMISWGKKGDLHARRQALRFVKSKEAMSQLFEDLAERYKDREGGYSRIIKLGKKRLGDNSEMAIVQLIGSEADQLSSLKSKSSKKKKAKKKDGTVLKEVIKEVQAEGSSTGKTKLETLPNESAISYKEAESKAEVKKEITGLKETPSKTEIVEEEIEVESAPSQIDIAEESNAADEVNVDQVSTETKVAAEQVNEETKSEAIPVKSEEETEPEKVAIEDTSSGKKTD